MKYEIPWHENVTNWVTHHKEIPGMHKQPKSPLWCCYYVEPTQVSNNTPGLHCHWKDWTRWQRIMESLDVKHNILITSQRCSWNMKRQCTHIIGKPWIRVEIRSSQAGWKELNFLLMKAVFHPFPFEC